MKKTKLKMYGNLHSISMKIGIMAFIMILVSITAVTLIASIESRTNYDDTYKKYVLSLAEEVADVIDETDVTDYSSILKNVKLKDIDSSYSYLVDSDGIVLYHPTKEKIGTQITNEVVNNLVDEMKSGNVPEDGVSKYNYDGQKKYIGYAITKDHKVAVVGANEDEVMKPINHMIFVMIILGIIGAIACTSVAFFIAMKICKPIKKLSSVIKRIESLDFTELDSSSELLKGKDEIGIMVNDIKDMHDKLKEIINSINNAGLSMTDSVGSLNDMIVKTNSICTDNSATTEELAAGMEETSATTVNINENVQAVKEKAEEIADIATEGVDHAVTIMNEADSIQSNTVETIKNVNKTYELLKANSKIALEGLSEIHKINEMTETIKEIASQTKLLSLNASIEAVHAGDSGKGFSVVAAEINKLSTQTSDAITRVEDIVEGINNAVDSIINVVSDTTNFLENTVVPGYDEFKEVAEKYKNDVSNFKDQLTTTKENIDELKSHIDSSAEAINGINDIINESAIGISDIAEKTTDLVSGMETSSQIADKCKDCTEELDRIVKMFKLN